MALTCWLCGCMWGGLKKGTVASACLSVCEKAVSQLPPWCQTLQFLSVNHWCLSSCYPSAGVQREWVWVSLCGGSLRGMLWVPEVFSTDPTPTGFTGRSCGELSSWHWNPGLGVYSEIFLRYPSGVFIYHLNVGSACSMSAPLLPVWMDVVSLIT